ncbi:MAG: TatD family hydrolase [Deltaproteobacteria bacterium]|nr:TatD family hydrolase [Deltaproteobacteria bacterium]
MPLIDSHCHLDAEYFGDEVDAVIDRAVAAGVVKMITVATGPENAKHAVALADRRPEIFVALGMHPHDARLWDDKAEAAFTELAAHPKVVAWGEIGLDYHYDHSPRDVQREIFAHQIRLARERGLPIVIHTREADDDTLAVLRAEADGPYRGVFHCFGGDARLAQGARELGFHLSVTGTISFKREMPVHGVLRGVGMENILVETDSPYLTPKPYRGKRNEPAYTVHVAEALANIFSVTFDDVAASTWQQTHALFNRLGPA